MTALRDKQKCGCKYGPAINLKHHKERMLFNVNVCVMNDVWIQTQIERLRSIV